jgi:hypothetical protein
LKKGGGRNGLNEPGNLNGGGGGGGGRGPNGL